MCCIICLSSLKSLDIFQETVTDILILCQSHFEHKITELSKMNLVSKINVSNIKMCYEKYLEYLSSENTCIKFPRTFLENSPLKKKFETAIFTFINNLKLKAFKMSSTQSNADINSYFCPNLTAKLVDLLVDFPVWTKMIECISDDLSDTITSSTVTYSSFLKNSFDSSKTAPNFIKSHWESLKSSCQHGRLLINEQHLAKKKKNQRKITDHNYLKLEENWKGKNKLLNLVNDISTENDIAENDKTKLNLKSKCNCRRKTFSRCSCGGLCTNAACVELFSRYVLYSKF